MLGFGPLGKLALGEIPQGQQTVVLTAASGSYAVTGNAAAFGSLLSTAGGSYTVTGNDAQLVGIVGSGSYAVTGNAAGFSTNFVAATGSYLVTGQAASLATLFGAAPGRYYLTGTDAALIAAVDSGNYAVTGSDALFPTSFAAEGGQYIVTLGDYEIRRTGYDHAPDQYGIGHIKLAMVEARRRRSVVKPAPYPVINQPPRLPAFHARQPVAAPFPGLIGGNDFLDRLVQQQQQQQQAQAAALQVKQAKDRAIAALLLAA